MRREGIEPPRRHPAYFVTTGLQPAAGNTSRYRVARVGVEPTKSRRFELRRFACLRTLP
jgi:hypothetical protein